jgi:hypothetical protein
MNHDHELLREEIVYASRTELRGPIPERLVHRADRRVLAPHRTVACSPKRYTLVVVLIRAQG